MRPREPRQKVVLPARMRAGAGQIEICIRDVSSRGMLVQAAFPPARGTYVEIVRPACTIVGRVVWCKDRRFGIETRERIVLSVVLDRRTVVRTGDTGPGAPPVQAASRKRRRTRSLPHQAELSRQRGRTVQYASMAAAAGVSAVLAASLLYQSLADVVGSISSSLT